VDYHGLLLLANVAQEQALAIANAAKYNKQMKAQEEAYLRKSKHKKLAVKCCCSNYSALSPAAMACKLSGNNAKASEVGAGNLRGISLRVCLAQFYTLELSHYM
jgi:hypothetical protein